VFVVGMFVGWGGVVLWVGCSDGGGGGG